MRKHTYTREAAPTTTGSVSRPARTNLRETCEVHARTLKAFSALREMTGMPKGACLADVWEQKMLPLVEHAIWHLRESPTAVKSFVATLTMPLPREDYVRNQYQRLKERFQPTLPGLSRPTPAVAAATSAPSAVLAAVGG